jgi:hypothetical protein
MTPFKTPPTDNEIDTYVYSNTYNETGDNITWLINGMKHMRDSWKESLIDPSVPWIYERDGDTVYRRRHGSTERKII